MKNENFPWLLAVDDNERNLYSTKRILDDLDITSLNFGNYYALVIGNNNYQYVTELKTAINDAKSVGNILQNEYGFKVKLLIRHDCPRLICPLAM